MTWTTKTRRARALLPTIALLAASVGLGACGDDDDIVAVNPTAVTTFNDASFNFASLPTIAMPDTVVHFAPLTRTPLTVTRQFDQTALNQLGADFLARGYTQVPAGAAVRPFFLELAATTA